MHHLFPMSIQSLDFPNRVIDFQLTENTNGAEEAHLAFLKERQLEEEEMGRKALADLQKREQNRKENGDAPPSGPFQLGTPIKNNEPIMEIRNIQDEERSVIIEGYVFDAEVRELRSGRSFLRLKLPIIQTRLLLKCFRVMKKTVYLCPL